MYWAMTVGVGRAGQAWVRESVFMRHVLLSLAHSLSFCCCFRAMLHHLLAAAASVPRTHSCLGAASVPCTTCPCCGCFNAMHKCPAAAQCQAHTTCPAVAASASLHAPPALLLLPQHRCMHRLPCCCPAAASPPRTHALLALLLPRCHAYTCCPAAAASMPMPHRMHHLPCCCLSATHTHHLPCLTPQLPQCHLCTTCLLLPLCHAHAPPAAQCQAHAMCPAAQCPNNLPLRVPPPLPMVASAQKGGVE